MPTCRRGAAMDSFAQAGMPEARSASRTMRRWSVDQDRMFDLLMEFNLFPARYAHASWRELIDERDAVGNWQQPIDASPFWIRHASMRLLNEAGLQDRFDCDFSDAGRRFALLDGMALQRLGQFAAAVLVRHRLQPIVDRAAVEKLQKVIGAAAHRFALRWSQPLPRVPAEFSNWDEPWPTLDIWMARQASIVQAVIAPEAAAIRGRMRFKSPRHVSAAAVQLSEPQRIGLTRLLSAVVTAEIPEWSWLFATESPAQPGARSGA